MLEKDIDFFKKKEKKKRITSKKLEHAFIISIPILIFLRIILTEIYLQPTELTFIPEPNSSGQVAYINKEHNDEQLDAKFPNTNVLYKNVPIVDSFKGFVENDGYSQQYLDEISQ